jgi:hypothetical protein
MVCEVDGNKKRNTNESSQVYGIGGSWNRLRFAQAGFCRIASERFAGGAAGKALWLRSFWRVDYGPVWLPAYRYTCDQLTDPHAQTPTHKGFLASNDHLHEVGNDRVVAVASNFGYVQVRQDEGAPKFLNDYSPDQNRYGGGIGYLTDGKAVLSTYYPGGGESFERILGEGYLRKIVRGSGFIVDQTVFAPFGDDPVLISLVKITNRGSETVNARWVEYWGCSNYQISFRTTMEAGALKGCKGGRGVETPLCRAV